MPQKSKIHSENDGTDEVNNVMHILARFDNLVILKYVCRNFLNAAKMMQFENENFQTPFEVAYDNGNYQAAIFFLENDGMSKEDLPEHVAKFLEEKKHGAVTYQADFNDIPSPVISAARAGAGDRLSPETLKKLMRY